MIAIELNKPFALIAEEGVAMGSINAQDEVDDAINTGTTLTSCVQQVRGKKRLWWGPSRSSKEGKG